MDAFICDAQRTPIGRFGGALSSVRADDLAAAPIAALMARNPDLDWSKIDDVIFGCANQAGEDNRNVARMAALLAGLPVVSVIDHIGHFKFEEGVDHPAFRALVDHVRGGRCWVKLSGQYRISQTNAPFTDVPPMAHELLRVRPDRMVWATDWPHVMLMDKPMPNDADILDWTESWGVDDATIRQVLVDNPAELYGFG